MEMNTLTLQDAIDEMTVTPGLINSTNSLFEYLNMTG